MTPNRRRTIGKRAANVGPSRQRPRLPRITRSARVGPRGNTNSSRARAAIPKGAKRKPPSLLPDLKRLFEQALSEKVTLKQGEKRRTLTMAEAGIKQLVAQFAKGDRHARRDVFAYAEMLGIDLVTGHRTAIEGALASDHEAILLKYVQRQYDKVWTPPRDFAPPELLDDDLQEQKQN